VGPLEPIGVILLFGSLPIVKTEQSQDTFLSFTAFLINNFLSFHSKLKKTPVLQVLATIDNLPKSVIGLIFSDKRVLYLFFSSSFSVCGFMQ